MQPHRWQPTRLPHPWDSPGKNTGVGCHFLLQCMKVKSESEVAQSCPTPSDPWTAAHQAPPSMGFSRQEYWSGLPKPHEIINKTKGNNQVPQNSSVQFSRSVVSDSLRLHEPKHARPHCPSPTPAVHPIPCPSSW